MPRHSAHPVGKWEAPLIEKVCKHFSNLGYTVYPHAGLNMAYGHIDDADVLAVKDGEITVIEIKSNHDKPKRALKQGEIVTGLVDHYYLAVEKPINFDFPWGVLLVKDEVEVLKEAGDCRKTTLSALMLLLQPCLNQMLGMKYAGKNSLCKQLLPVVDEKMPMIRLALLCDKRAYPSWGGKEERCGDCPIKLHRPLSTIKKPKQTALFDFK